MTFEQLKEQVRTISETLEKPELMKEELMKLFEDVKNLDNQLEKEKDTINLEGVRTEDLERMISELTKIRELLKNAREDIKAC